MEITASEITNEPVQDEFNTEQLEGNDLVKVARGLFEGTLVQVKSIEKKDQ